MISINQIIQHFNLAPHPEGGYYQETYRSNGKMQVDVSPDDTSGSRNYSTAIY
ncbi:MAG: cupin domain-containing protein, partial [Bacteriovoracaceae bacterium]|nr:cupin domain-containing protein [Bacteriovoracaceae bacterium]